MLAIRDLSIDFSEFPELVRRHRSKYPDTPKVEAQASALVQSGFEPQLAVDFVRAVCKWGGFAGIAGRVIKNNTKTDVAKVIRDSHRRLTEGDPLAGLQNINRLYGLGRPSFASKHLQFLAPQVAVILDSVMSTRFGYPMNLDGYEQLLEDCEALTAAINRTSIEHPFRTSGRYVSDIELAVFAQIQRL
jgi:hypothetical protein